MKLSKAMVEHLMYMDKFPPGCGMTMGRPTHWGNLITHNALLKRGLIREDDDAFYTTWLTPAGTAAIAKLKEEGRTFESTH